MLFLCFSPPLSGAREEGRWLCTVLQLVHCPAAYGALQGDAASQPVPCSPVLPFVGAAALFLIYTSVKKSYRSVEKAGECGLEKRLPDSPGFWQPDTSSLLGICSH